jgi:hypothetical protein
VCPFFFSGPDLFFSRLDSFRRDMVKEFQNNSSYFAFLLSTRAGGLGINLTSVRHHYRSFLLSTLIIFFAVCCVLNQADTVIFYDNDVCFVDLLQLRVFKLPSL